MPDTFSYTTPGGSTLAGKSVEDLLLLVADDDKGVKPDAIEMLLSMDFPDIYPVLENCVRNNDNADLRNSAMEVLVKFGRQSLPRLIKLLRDKDEEVRNFAAVMLGDIGNREAVGALIQTLNDKDINVSHGAAEALGKIGDRAALLPLIELLKGDFWLQYAAITAIGAMRDYRAVPHLLNLLDNELLSESVIQSLGEIGDPRALYPLCRILSSADGALAGKVSKTIVAIFRNINETLKYKNSLLEFSQPTQLKDLLSNESITRLHSLLENSSETGVVEAAVTILGWVGDCSAINSFFGLLEETNYIPAVESAILSLGESASEHLIAALDHENDNVKTVAIRSLRWTGKNIDPLLLGRLIASDNESVQIEALETLKTCRIRQLLPPLYQLLLHENKEISGRAAEALGNFPASEIQQFLESLVHSSEPVKRIRAAELLGHLKNCGGMDLLGVLASDREPAVRCGAMRSVGLQQFKEALPLLHETLADPDPGVKGAAVMALAEFGKPNFVEEILSLLNEGDEQLDYLVVRAIGMMSAAEAGPALIKYLSEDRLPKNLEYAIIETLGKISCTAASSMISAKYMQHADPDIRRLAVETLGKLGDQQSLKEVENATQDPHWSVRVAALHVLGRIGGAAEIPLLLAAMDDKDYMVKKNAILELGNLRDISTVPALAHQLTDMEMSRYAFEALLKYGRMALPWLHRLMTRNYPLELRVRVIDLIGKISDHRSVEPLMGLLDESCPDIRLAAIDSLTFCYDSIPLKKLAAIKKNDSNDDVRERAELALKTFMMEKYF